jgi:hypothetical protein
MPAYLAAFVINQSAAPLSIHLGYLRGSYMLDKKRISILLASAMLMAACGGGGGGNNPPAAGGDGTNNPSTGNPTDDSGGDNIPSTDQRLNGYLEIGANQLIFIPGDRERLYGFDYNGGPIEYFEGKNYTGGETGTNLDIAAGGTAQDMTNPAVEIKPSVPAPAAPIASFGFRVKNEVYSSAGVVRQGVQTAVGRVAFEFVERASTAGGNAERMTFIIDKVELGTNANGGLITARAQDGAQVYVSGTNAAGVTVNETIPAPANSVRLMPLYHVADHNGDESAQVLQIDLEQAFSQAGDRLLALHNLRGEFDMHVTLSSLEKFVRPYKAVTIDPEWTLRDLVGKSIEMTGHAPVTGAGVSGRVLVREHVTPG